MSWWLYILRCADDTLYCGITNDLDRRIAQHNAGVGAKYTRGRGPVELVYSEECRSKSEALKFEIQAKKMKRADKLRLIQAEAKLTQFLAQQHASES